MQRNQHSIEIQSLWERPKSTLSSLSQRALWARAVIDFQIRLLRRSQQNRLQSSLLREKTTRLGKIPSPFVSLSTGDISSPLDEWAGWSLLIKKLAWQYVNICVALFRCIIFAELSSWGSVFWRQPTLCAEIIVSGSSQQPQTAHIVCVSVIATAHDYIALHIESQTPSLQADSMCVLLCAYMTTVHLCPLACSQYMCTHSQHNVFQENRTLDAECKQVWVYKLSAQSWWWFSGI